MLADGKRAHVVPPCSCGRQYSAAGETATTEFPPIDRRLGTNRLNVGVKDRPPIRMLEKMRILFCGETFPSARLLLEQRLSPAASDVMSVWPDRSSLTSLNHVDVLIPMMFGIDAAVMDTARGRLLQQWGSGFEGIDLAAARGRGIPVASVPASGDNADSVAEHAILLMLALLRRLPDAQANVRAGVLGAPLGHMLAGRTV